jgi:hypothetical protein
MWNDDNEAPVPPPRPPSRPPSDRDDDDRRRLLDDRRARGGVRYVKSSDYDALRRRMRSSWTTPTARREGGGGGRCAGVGREVLRGCLLVSYPPSPPPRLSKTNDLSTRRRRRRGSAGPSPCRASTPPSGWSIPGSGGRRNLSDARRTDGHGRDDGGKMIRGATVAGDPAVGRGGRRAPDPRTRRRRGERGCDGACYPYVEGGNIVPRYCDIVRKVGMRQSVGGRGCDRRSCHRRAGGSTSGRTTIVCMKKELVGGMFGNLFRRRR